MSIQHGITKGLEARKKEIDDYHAKHQIDAAEHNLRNREKKAINEVTTAG